MPKGKRFLNVKKPYITKGQVEAAIAFLGSDPIGKRVHAAENMLILLAKDFLPNLKYYIFNAAYDLRKIINNQEFDRLINSSPNLADLLNSTAHGGYIRASLDSEQIRFLMFYNEQLSFAEADLYSKSLGQIVAATLSVLGIDMSQYFANEKSTAKELLEIGEKLQAAAGERKKNEG